MLKLKWLNLIVIFTLILGVGRHLVCEVNQAYALADCWCIEWDCPDRFDGTWDDPYPAGYQQCRCIANDCISWGCPPGSYVCNRDGQCCEYGYVYPIDDDSSGENTCGNGICDEKETCDNCLTDCGECCGDGTCNYGETCLTCEEDCGPCDEDNICGDGICSGDEVCDECWVDCGFCPFCGDYECNGFETCATCEEDCGACAENVAWWQVWGGNFAAESNYGYVIRSLIPDITVCLEPACYSYLSVTDRAGSADSDGFPFLSGGEILDNDQVSAREEQVMVTGTTITHLRETYSYFYSEYSLGFSPEDDYSSSDGDALKPSDTKDAYFHSGDLTIQSPWQVTAGERYVVFVDGNLNIEDPSGVGELITVDEGGFLAFIVSGDINIAESVGHSTLSNTAGNIEGVYVADGTIRIMSNGEMDKRFIGEGTFVGWTDVEMLRDFGDEVTNQSYPTETFVYRPDFVRYTPEKMKRSQMIWQETN